MLPQRVVGILHRQGRQIRRSAPAARRVDARKIARQRRHRPAVARDVMQQQQQHVLALTKRKQMRPQRRLAGEIEALPRRRRQSLGKTLLADRHHRNPRPCGGCFKDQLPRNPQRVGEDRAQALVALHHVAERSLDSAAVERTVEAHRHRDRVGRAPPLQAVEEPQPALRKRQRDLGRARDRTQRRTRRLRHRPDVWPEPRRWGLRTGCGSRSRHPSVAADAADQPRRQQRMAAELEEVVVDADPLQPQHLGKQRAQDLLLRRARPAPDHRA